MLDSRARRKRTAAFLWLAMLGPVTASFFYAYLLENPVVAGAVYYGSKLCFILLPLAWWRVVVRQRLAPARPRLAGMAAGVAFGLVSATTIVTLYFLLLAGRLPAERLQSKAELFGASDYYLAFAVFLAVANSAYEEYYWRWFVFGRLRDFTSVGVAAAASSVAFGLHHFVVVQVFFQSTGLALVATAGVVLGGVCWALIYHRWGNLWAPWLSHLVVDAALLVVGHDLLYGMH